MKYKSNIVVVLLLIFTPWVVVSCVKDTLGEEPADTNGRIAICPAAGIPTVEVTRSGAVGPSEDTGGISISMFRIDRNATTGEYPTTYDDTDVNLYAATITGNTKDGTGQINFTPTQVYSLDYRSVKVIGLHPAIGTENKSRWEVGRARAVYTLNGKQDIMITKLSEGIPDEGTRTAQQPVQQFEHVLSQVRIAVAVEDEEASLKWKGIEKMDLTAQPATCELLMPDIDTELAPTVNFTGTTTVYPVYNDTHAEAAMEQEEITQTYTPFGYVLIPPKDEATVLRFIVNTGAGTVRLSIPERIYKPGVAYQINLKLTVEEIIPEVTVMAWDETPEEVEAGASVEDNRIVPQEPANCHIMPPGGSIIYLTMDQPNTYWATEDPSKVINPGESITCEVLWMDASRLITCNTTEDSNGAPLIEITGNLLEKRVGNAVVVVKVGGEIRWSWHIWVVDYDPHENDDLWMDRNLGATSANPEDWVKTYGLYYQWGRKDPFPAATSGGGEPILYNGTGISFQYATYVPNLEPIPELGVPTLTRELQSIAWTIQNPITYISNREWMLNSTADDTNWNNADNSKTIYDPCPAGWRMPVLGAWDHLTKDNFIWSGGGSTNNDIGGWYPTASYRSIDGAFYTFHPEGYYWLGTPNGKSGGYHLYFDRFGVYPQRATSRSSGLLVRCKRE